MSGNSALRKTRHVEREASMTQKDGDRHREEKKVGEANARGREK